MTVPIGIANWSPSTKHRRVLAFVAECCGLKPAVVLGRSRHREIVRVRQLASWIMRRCFPTLSYPQIGRIFGGQDHSTVIHSCKQVEWRLEREPDLARFVEAILAELESANLTVQFEVSAAVLDRIAEAGKALRRDLDGQEPEVVPSTDVAVIEQFIPPERWCEQCQSRKATAQVANCQWRFCSLKPKAVVA